MEDGAMTGAQEPLRIGYNDFIDKTPLEIEISALVRR